MRHAPERVADRPRLVAGYATQAATAAEAADGKVARAVRLKILEMFMSYNIRSSRSVP